VSRVGGKFVDSGSDWVCHSDTENSRSIVVLLLFSARGGVRFWDLSLRFGWHEALDV
jgi:hypothetical protein